MISILCLCLTLSLPSFQGWGSTQGMYHASVGNKVQVHYFHNTKPPIADNNLQSSFGVSYRPIQTKIFEGGILLTNRGFPTQKSIQVNFIVDVGYTFDRFRLSYAHISNGFGILNPYNDGYDTINLRINLTK